MLFKWLWKDPATGWDMMINIVPAGDGIIDRDGSYIQIPEEVISFKEFSKGKQERLIGMAKAPYIKVSLNLEYLPNDDDYEAFRDAITSPQVEKVVALTGSHFWDSLTITAGTIWELFKDDDGNGYQKLMTGLQIDGIEDLYDSENNSIDLTIEHLSRHVMESVDFKQITKVIPATDLYIATDQSWVFSYIFKTQHCADYEASVVRDYSDGESFNFAFYRIYQKYYQLIKAHDALTLALSRTNQFTSVLYMPQEQLYKQSFGATDVRGAEVDFYSFFHLAYIKKVSDGEIIDGYLFTENKNGMFGKYSNMYDYLADMAEQSYNTFDYEADYVSFIRIYPDYLSEIEIIKDDTTRQKLQHAPIKINSIVASLWEFNEGDVEEIFSPKSGTTDRDTSYTIPIVENISQLVPTEDEGVKEVDVTLHGGETMKLYVIKNKLLEKPYRGHTSAYYYTTVWETFGNNNLWVMVNPRPKVNFNSSYSSDDLQHAPGWFYNHVNNFAMQVAEPSSVHYVWQLFLGHAGMSRASLFEHCQLSEKLTLEVPISLYKELLDYNRRIKFDCSKLAPRYSNRPTYWRIVTLTWEVESGKLTVELIPEYQNAT
ncbi:MAG TPA: hypothetical protein DCS19_04125 [Flavobacterium sp.]|nr:hypothetical protein [Flavobacterium sp.]